MRTPHHGSWCVMVFWHQLGTKLICPAVVAAWSQVKMRMNQDDCFLRYRDDDLFGGCNVSTKSQFDLRSYFAASEVHSAPFLVIADRCRTWLRTLLP